MSLSANIQDLATRISTEVKALRTLINGNAVDLSALTTTAKTNLVAAINEVDAIASAITGPPAASETVAGVVELATTAEASTGTDTSRAVTAAGLKAAIDAANAALVDAAPGTLDTLNELAAALGDDPNFASTMTTALGNRVRADVATQGLTSTQQGNARTNIDVYSKAEIGDITTNFVNTFNAGLT